MKPNIRLFFFLCCLFFTVGHASKTKAPEAILSDWPSIAATYRLQLNHIISPYDRLFKQYAAETAWDWQLLASIAYQESKFHVHPKSHAGARGLMGIMPRTARSLGFSPDSLVNPEISIQAGVRCLHAFEEYFPDMEAEEKIKFTLAAYNAGNGHITDARKLASKYGKNPDLWNDVAEFIRLKSKPEYYNDPVCKHGYLRGIETSKYVKEVTERYKSYKSRT